MTVTGPNGNETTFTYSYTQELPTKHGVSLTIVGGDTASSDTDGDGRSSDGDVVTFALTVTNTGTVDLTGVEVQAAILDGLSCQRFVPSANTTGLWAKCILGLPDFAVRDVHAAHRLMCIQFTPLMRYHRSRPYFVSPMFVGQNKCSTLGSFVLGRDYFCVFS